ncbi:adenylosuccinate synthetase [Holotrichia oblita]|nr:adenylosuccinate synthetase [Holotrichia oblita]
MNKRYKGGFNMPVRVIVGAQWGDEGKGKIVDYFAKTADMVVRFQGGDNAGHTVVNSAGTFKLHIVPCGVFKPDCVCFCGTGMVINPDEFILEIAQLESQSVRTQNVLISSKAIILMPYHVEFDRSSERGAGAIGSTKRGIGFAYADKARRLALRFEDLSDLNYCSDRLDVILAFVNADCKKYGVKPVSKLSLMDKLKEWAVKLGPRIVEPVTYINEKINEDKNIIFEGQLGVMKDIDLGIYPYVTSSNPVAAYAAVSSGFSCRKITNILGVMKAFSSAVGKGPFITEMSDDEAVKLRGTGENIDDEFGARTGRARRIGWLDLMVVKYAALVNGFNEIALCKLDKLDGLKEIKVCIGYKLNGKPINYMPSARMQYLAEPVYTTLPGWLSDTTNIKNIIDLPANAKKYIELIEQITGVPVKYVGVGPGRDNIAL